MIEKITLVEFAISVGALLGKILLYLILAKILIKVSNKSVDKLATVSVRFKSNPGRTATLTSLIKSIIKYTIYIFVAGVPILKALHFPIESLLAVAGLGGVAIGFGAQSLVKDIVTGFFILFEDQYSVGDFVDITGMSGTVEAVELRITKLRGFGGELYTIPNGEVKTVINWSRGNSTAVIEISIAYESDVNAAMKIMEKTAIAYKETHEEVVDGPTMLGVTNLGNSGVSIKLILKTLPMNHYQVERDVRKAIKEAFDLNQIEIPYNKVVIIKD